MIIKLIIIHLGKNPINGGNPPNERKLIKIFILINGLILLMNNWLIKNIFIMLNEKHKILIISEYTIKKKNHKFSLIIKEEIIHPRLLIEEKAITFRNDVWFNPPNAPIIVLRIIIIIIKFIFI